MSEDNQKRKITKTKVKPHKRSNPKSSGEHHVKGHYRKTGKKTNVREHWREVGGASYKGSGHKGTDEIVVDVFHYDSGDTLGTYIFPKGALQQYSEEELRDEIMEAYREVRNKENYGIEDFEKELDKRDIHYQKPTRRNKLELGL